MEQYDVIVVGQGYAGLTAAKLASQRGLRTANYEGHIFGGLILNINELDPAPEGAEHSGSELSSNLAMANMDGGVVNISEPVTGVERGNDGVWLVKTDTGTSAARHVIAASGAHLRKLNVPGEEEFFGQGVSECADCDGPLFKGLDTVVVGGGNSAFQEALALADFASKITIVMRGDGPRARAELVERVASNPKVTLLTHTRLVAIQGTPGKGVESVTIQTTGQGEVTLDCGGVFVFIGLEPNTAFLPAELARDAAGALVTSNTCATDLPGLWAIGAVRSGYKGLLTDAEAEALLVVEAIS